MVDALKLIQSELKAPKGQYNSFGKYKYRSCEDILEAVKPLLAKHNAALTLSDELVMVGDRYYIKATATLSTADGNNVSTTAYAREDESKKGMDGSQVTGTASSYARKYALNGLFCIDDTKDSDTEENHNEQQARARQAQGKSNGTQQQAQSKSNTQRTEINNPTAADVEALAAEAAQNLNANKVTDSTIGQIQYLCKEKTVLPAQLCQYYKVANLKDLTVEQGEDCLKRLKFTKAKA